jgi:hypothetical protein
MKAKKGDQRAQEEKTSRKGQCFFDNTHSPPLTLRQRRPLHTQTLPQIK